MTDGSRRVWVFGLTRTGSFPCPLNTLEVPGIPAPLTKDGRGVRVTLSDDDMVAMVRTLRCMGIRWKDRDVCSSDTPLLCDGWDHPEGRAGTYMPAWCFVWAYPDGTLPPGVVPEGAKLCRSPLALPMADGAPPDYAAHAKNMQRLAHVAEVGRRARERAQSGG